MLMLFCPVFREKKSVSFTVVVVGSVGLFRTPGLQWNGSFSNPWFVVLDETSLWSHTLRTNLEKNLLAKNGPPTIKFWSTDLSFCDLCSGQYLIVILGGGFRNARKSLFLFRKYFAVSTSLFKNRISLSALVLQLLVSRQLGIFQISVHLPDVF